MKARIKSTSQIIEVETIYDENSIGNVHFLDTNNNKYFLQELDFIDPDSEEETITGWLARDENGDINIFDSVPHKVVGDFWMNQGCYYLMKDLQYENPNIFPSVTWESDPLKVRITIAPIK